MPSLKREWTPHPKQRAIMADTARFRIVPAGRRFGKTFMAKNEAFEFAFENPGALVCYFAPTDDDARDLAFDPLRKAIPDSLIAGEPKRTPPREIPLTNGARMRFRGMKGSTRGRGYDYVVIDEAGESEDDFLQAVIRPTLSDTGGSLLAIGTPRRKNWFYSWYLRGKDPDRPDYSSWTATTYDNPHIPDSEVEAAREDLPERVFRQEYLAEFVEDEGEVFPNPETVARPYSLDAVSGTGPYSTGIDLARTSNYLVATTLDADGMLVGFMRTRGGSWAAAGRKMTAYLADYPGVAYLDATRDNKVVEDLAREVESVQVEPVRFTPQSKANMVENLAARLELKDIVLPDPAFDEANEPVEALFAELRAFEYDTTPAGNIRYGAPEGENDDTVDALALAAKESEVSKATW